MYFKWIQLLLPLVAGLCFGHHKFMMYQFSPATAQTGYGRLLYEYGELTSFLLYYFYNTGQMHFHVCHVMQVLVSCPGVASPVEYLDVIIFVYCHFIRCGI